MAMSELKQKLLLYELAQIGFPHAQYHSVSDRIFIQPDNDRMPKIGDKGEFYYGTEYDSLATDTLRPLFDRVNEATAAWDKSDKMPFEDLNQFRVLAEYNGIMMAARDDTAIGHGLHFVTWQYNHDRTGLVHGHYTEDYTAAKEDFAVRSGLIPEVKLFTQEQAAELKAAIEYRLNNDEDITYSTENDLNLIAARLRAAYPVSPEKNENDKPEQVNETQERPTANAINGEIACFDLVISIGDCKYPFLVGEVNAVDKLGSPEHDGQSDTDNVFVDFQSEEYSAKRIEEIEEHFSRLLDKPKSFIDLIQVANLYNVKMSPKNLIRINENDLKMLLESRQNAKAFCNLITSSLCDTTKTEPKTKTLEEKMQAAKEKVKAQDANGNKNKTNYRGERE